MTSERRAERDIRHARWLLEQAAPALASMPALSEAMEAARQLCGQAAGDYQDGEERAFSAMAKLPVLK